MKQTESPPDLWAFVTIIIVWLGVIFVTSTSDKERDLQNFYRLADLITAGLIGYIAKGNVEHWIGDRRQSEQPKYKRTRYIEYPYEEDKPPIYKREDKYLDDV